MIRFVLSVISVNLYNDQTRCFVNRMGKYFSSLLGLIEHTDDAKRTVLKEKAIAYLCKEEQSIDPLKQSGSERSFTRGIAPRKKSNAGRPRQGDSVGADTGDAQDVENSSLDGHDASDDKILN